MIEMRERPTSGTRETRERRAPGVADESDEIDWDARITMAEASRISGLAPESLRGYVRSGELRSELMAVRLRVTTRRWLDDLLQRRKEPGSRGPKPKPLPEGYQAPPPPAPARGRPGAGTGGARDAGATRVREDDGY